MAKKVKTIEASLLLSASIVFESILNNLEAGRKSYSYDRPAEVFKMRGKYVIIDGHHRLMERYIKGDSLDAIVIKSACYKNHNIYRRIDKISLRDYTLTLNRIHRVTL